jgi:DNA polymerase
MTDLDKLEAVVDVCTKCPLVEMAQNKVFGEGNPKARAMFVGEAPGREENASGRPFVGAAGQLLDKGLAKLGVERATVYIANINKCWPPGNRKPEKSESAACIGYLEKQIELIMPKIIIALGATAAQTLLEIHSSIGKIRGKVMAGPHGVLVLPTWHPSYILRMGGIGNKTRQKRAAKEFIADLTMAFSIAGIEHAET